MGQGHVAVSAMMTARVTVRVSLGVVDDVDEAARVTVRVSLGVVDEEEEEAKPKEMEREEESNGCEHTFRRGRVEVNFFASSSPLETGCCWLCLLLLPARQRLGQGYGNCLPARSPLPFAANGSPSSLSSLSSLSAFSS